MSNLITLVYTTDLDNSSFIIECKKKGVKCIPTIDARSAVYMATGICAQNQSKVAVCVDSGNSSRSAFSGMTEAFYRKLPVALITIGKKLDYTKELNDVVVEHYTAQNYVDIQRLMNRELPIHIELFDEEQKQKKIECDSLQQILSSVLDENTYLYVSQGIQKSRVQYKGKVVYGGMPDCYDGALANILGASLAKKHKKYIGLVSEKEFIHDINTLGNINMNELICYIVIENKRNKLIVDSAAAMKFEVFETKFEDLTPEKIKSLVIGNNKTLLMIYEEE